MEMFQYDFIQRAFLAGTIMSLVTPILGLLLILRRQSLMADTLSHISLAGVALGLYLGKQPTWTTLVVVVIASVIIEILRQIYADYSEISVALMMSAGMAVALVLMNLNTNAANVKVDQYLFGSILLINDEQIKILGVITALVLVAYIIFRRPLYVLSFDEATAHTAGLPTRWMSIIFSAITGMVISVMMPIVGGLLVSALIVIPAATAIKVSRSFTQAIVLGMLINLIGTYSGIGLSYHWDTPPGASITLCFIAIFLLITVIDSLYQKIRRKDQPVKDNKTKVIL